MSKLEYLRYLKLIKRLFTEDVHIDSDNGLLC